MSSIWFLLKSEADRKTWVIWKAIKEFQVGIWLKNKETNNKKCNKGQCILAKYFCMQSLLFLSEQWLLSCDSPYSHRVNWTHGHGVSWVTRSCIIALHVSSHSEDLNTTSKQWSLEINTALTSSLVWFHGHQWSYSKQNQPIIFSKRLYNLPLW